MELGRIPELLREARCNMSDDRTDLLAGLYGLVLRQQGYAVDEAAALVIERYPGTRPKLEKFARRPVLDPLGTENSHLAQVLGAPGALGGVEEAGLVDEAAGGVRAQRQR